MGALSIHSDIQEARDYKPDLGRFISEDPIGFRSRSFNFYNYVGQNPIQRIDLYGENQYIYTTFAICAAYIAYKTKEKVIKTELKNQCEDSITEDSDTKTEAELELECKNSVDKKTFDQILYEIWKSEVLEPRSTPESPNPNENQSPRKPRRTSPRFNRGEPNSGDTDELY